MHTWRLWSLSLALALLAACGAGVEGQEKEGSTGVEPASTSTTFIDPSGSTAGPATTAMTGTSEARSTSQHSNILDRFVPEVVVEDGTAMLAVEFLDGSSAQLRWPATLDLVSGGVAPYGWAFVPQRFARDFFIRLGRPEEVVGLLGTPRLLSEYPDGEGGLVGFWRPEGWDEVDYLAFQFDSWVVLVYDYRTAAFGGDPMSDEDRQLWATNLHGQETATGFLRLLTDPPLELAPAGGYPSPMNLGLHSPGASIGLVPEACSPGFVSPIHDGDDFSHWCDASGMLSLRVTGPPDYAQAVHDHLPIVNINVVGLTTSDGD